MERWRSESTAGTEVITVSSTSCLPIDQIVDGTAYWIVSTAGSAVYSPDSHVVLKPSLARIDLSKAVATFRS